MIESNIIKRFIVKSFLQNSEVEIPKIADIIMNSLTNRFLLNESVLVPSKNISGKISRCSKSVYKIVASDGKEHEVPADEIVRKYKIGFDDVCQFLDSITTVTPFGRIAIENVFEKINQPNFGSKPAMQPVYETFRPAGMPLRHKEPPQFIIPKIFQGHGRNPVKEKSIKTPEQKEVKKPRLDIKTLKRYIVPGLEGESIKNTMKIFIYFNTFSDNLKISRFSFKELFNALRDPDYSSDIAYNVHRVLIEIIEKDIKSLGNRFLNDISLHITELPEFESENSGQQIKKRAAFDMENWKAQARIFIQNLGLYFDSEKPLRFLDFAKKDDNRIEFICFLIDLSYYTESLREFIVANQNQIRLEKTKADQLHVLKKKGGEEARAEIDKLSSELRELSLKNTRNPLKANIGKYLNYILLFVDGSIILMDKNDFYVVNNDDARIILRELNIMNKTEKNTIMNLKEIIDARLRS